jgi:hypothetical protein
MQYRANHAIRKPQCVSTSTHRGCVKKPIRGARNNAARKAQHERAGGLNRAKEKPPGRRATATPSPGRRARASSAGCENQGKPESQGQAATPAKWALRNNSPGCICSRRLRNARRGPPVPGPGPLRTRPAPGCKPWPSSSSQLKPCTLRRKHAQRILATRSHFLTSFTGAALSAASISLRYLAGSLSKSFRQLLQQSFTSRSLQVNT